MSNTNTAQWGSAIAVLAVVLVLALAWSVYWLVALAVLAIVFCAAMIRGMAAGGGVERRRR